MSFGGLHGKHLKSPTKSHSTLVSFPPSPVLQHTYNPHTRPLSTQDTHENITAYPRHIQPRGGAGMLALSFWLLLRPQCLDVLAVRHRHLPAAGFRLRLLLRLRGRDVRPLRAGQRLHGVSPGLLQLCSGHGVPSLPRRHGRGRHRKRRRLRAVLGRRVLDRGRIERVRAVSGGNGVRWGPGRQQWRLPGGAREGDSNLDAHGWHY